jgi:hypothetical protein
MGYESNDKQQDDFINWQKNVFKIQRMSLIELKTFW